MIIFICNYNKSFQIKSVQVVIVKIMKEFHRLLIVNFVKINFIYIVIINVRIKWKICV